MSVKVDSGVSDAAYPEVFDIRAMRPQDKERKPGQISDELLQRYYNEGYVIIPDFFTKEELEPARETTAKLVDELANKLFAAGKIKERYEDYGLFQRLIKMEDDFPGTTVILHKVPNMPMGYRDIWTNERLLNLVEQLIGPDIAGSPVWNLRTKTPQNEATTVPWHQDNGYLDNRAYHTLVPTAWIPLLDANEENGCLEFATGGHRSGKTAIHQCCWGGTWYVLLEDKEMQEKLGVNMETDIKATPVPYGGLVLFQNLVPHRSLPNVSNDVRWSLDLRWQLPQDPDLLWGLKKPVVMRKADDPNYKVDWTEFNSVDRHEQQKSTVADTDLPLEKDTEFDTTIPGPWMKKWEVVHMNRHTERFKRDEELAKA